MNVFENVTPGFYQSPGWNQGQRVGPSLAANENVGSMNHFPQPEFLLLFKVKGDPQKNGPQGLST
jgi:hypothetical protein